VARTAVRRRLPAYVIGEPGTGKSTLADAMARELASRVSTWDGAAGDIGPVELAAMARELDDGAVLVIRHADRLSPHVQTDLAKLLAERENPLAILTLGGVSEEDAALTSALGGIEIELPPLRNRREDIPQLVAHLLAGTAHGVLRVSPTLQRAMTKADWLGNVSELRDFVNTAAARCDGVELGMDQLSESHRRALSPNVLSRLEDAELRQIREALVEAQGNRVRAAELLQIGRSTLYRKIELYERRGYDVAQ
jgi:DNA-binding NtrC family response regulator